MTIVYRQLENKKSAVPSLVQSHVPVTHQVGDIRHKSIFLTRHDLL
ncbi:hypothetical protein JIN82_00725 [Persicirhabdus sediminis]|uniref:Uncharacterized protein n=1 Tax=Persicirhabdus sediminis TaxID=454144 RepID=A0A8J7MA05_9BACT|nr:hypothetical protein [Persicirhabdus sediminis]MBK1789669.1 hypothetical protein [Persicirhabdus sediminis]